MWNEDKEVDRKKILWYISNVSNHTNVQNFPPSPDFHRPCVKGLSDIRLRIRLNKSNPPRIKKLSTMEIEIRFT